MAFYSGLFVPDRKILGAEVLNPIIAKSPFTMLPPSSDCLEFEWDHSLNRFSSLVHSGKCPQKGKCDVIEPLCKPLLGEMGSHGRIPKHERVPRRGLCFPPECNICRVSSRASTKQKKILNGGRKKERGEMRKREGGAG